jgi:hypothetical protein
MHVLLEETGLGHGDVQVAAHTISHVSLLTGGRRRRELLLQVSLLRVLDMDRRLPSKAVV